MILTSSALLSLGLVGVAAMMPVSPQPTALVDRLAAVVDETTILLSDVELAERLRLVDPVAGETALEQRSRVLWAIVDQRLRQRDIERFGPIALEPAEIEAAYRRAVARFGTEAEFRAELAGLRVGEEQLRIMVRNRLSVQRFIAERFSPLALVTLAEIESHYTSILVPKLEAEGAPVPPLEAVSEEIRLLLKETRVNEQIETWTHGLREKATIVIKLPELAR